MQPTKAFAFLSGPTSIASPRLVFTFAFLSSEMLTQATGENGAFAGETEKEPSSSRLFSSFVLENATL